MIKAITRKMIQSLLQGKKVIGKMKTYQVLKMNNCKSKILRSVLKMQKTMKDQNPKFKN